MSMNLDDVERLLAFNEALRGAIHRASPMHPEFEGWELENQPETVMAELADWLVEKFRKDVAPRAEEPRA